MPTDKRALARDVIDDVRSACQQSGRATTEAEVRRALESLNARDIDAIRRLARGGLTAALGPDALVDIAKGTPVHVASAREIGGYYAMKAERDALATLTHARVSDENDEWSDEEDVEVAEDDDFDEFEDEDLDDDEIAARWSDPEVDDMDFDDDAYSGHAHPHDEEDASEADEYEEIPAEKPKRPKRRVPTPADKEEAQVLMTLFAYHRDAVRVAQEVGVGLQALSDRIEELGLRRSIHRLLEQTTDIDVFSPAQVTTASTPSNPEPLVRKRSDRVAPKPLEEPAQTAFETSQPAAQTDPVNAHGTRVYRRTSEQAPARRQRAVDLAVRREYVREPRRRLPLPPSKTAQVSKTPFKAEEPEEPSLPAFSTLQGGSGKAILEKLLADEKANPRVLAKKLAERFDGPANRAINESDLRALLKAHGLAERFAELETSNTRFMLGFHQGARGKLANALLMTPQELDPYLTRLGLADELERLRAERSKLELGRKRLHDRISQVLTRAPYLDDLGVLPVIDREVQEQLGELFKAHKGDAEQVRLALGLEPNPFAKLLRRYDGLK